MLLFETEREVEEKDFKDSGELEKEDNSVCVLLMMTLRDILVTEEVVTYLIKHLG